MSSAVLRSAQVGAILTTLGLSVGLVTGVAEADPPRDHHCLSPIFPDSDLNTRYGVSERIIGPPGCREAFAGEQWVRAVPPWVTALNAATAVYPADYVPELPNPIDDFNAKFVGARYVNDAGTAQERTVTGGRELLRTGFFAPNGLPFSAPVSPVMHPLSVGTHTNTVFVTMRARHCNGRAPVPTPAPGLGAACLPEGESQYPILDNAPFTFLSQAG